MFGSVKGNSYLCTIKNNQLKKGVNMSKIQQVPQSKQWMFHIDNPKKNLPYINSRDYTLIKQSINNKRFVNQRVMDLTNRGFEVKRCFVPTYNGIGQPTYFPRLNEIRIIVGRPNNHTCREVFAVIIKTK